MIGLALIVAITASTALADCTGLPHSFACLNQETSDFIKGAVRAGNSEVSIGRLILDFVADGNAVFLEGTRFEVISGPDDDNLIIIKLSDGRKAITGPGVIRCK